ncbi:succinate dehydrogenase, hydrophobic membrane anchor protein [Alkalicaulis satelles]|nr:succinate dehydrogenase, hydrophobic membrane anchor protein [Alkalicaulis satelles]
MSGLRTPLSRAKGLGSARTGSGHFIAQRVSAVALIVLIPAFVWMIARLPALDYDSARAMIASPLGALVTLLTLTAAFYHMRLGLQVVIEDYITKPVTRAALLIANTLIAAGLWLAALYAVLVIAA